MASITKAKVIEINSKCGNGFRLDIQRCCVWNEKALFKYVDISEKEKLRFELSYHSEEPKRKIPTIYVSRWECSDLNPDVIMSSSGNLEFRIEEVEQKTKNVKTLQEISRNMSPDFIEKVKANYADLKTNRDILSIVNDKYKVVTLLDLAG